MSTLRDDELQAIEYHLKLRLSQHQTTLTRIAHIEADKNLEPWRKETSLQHLQSCCDITCHTNRGFSCEIKSWWKDGPINHDYDFVYFEIPSLGFNSRLQVESHYEYGPGNYDTGRGSSIRLYNTDFMPLIEDLCRLYTSVQIGAVPINAFVHNVTGAVFEQQLRGDND